MKTNTKRLSLLLFISVIFSPFFMPQAAQARWKKKLGCAFIPVSHRCKAAVAPQSPPQVQKPAFQPAPMPEDCWGSAILFEHENFGGQRVYLTERSAELSALRYQNFNDKASSICVPPGMMMTLHEHDNFQGIWLGLGNRRQAEAQSPKAYPRLNNSGWNDYASSARIHRINR